MKTLAPLLVLCSSIAGSVAHAASPDELVHRPLTPASQGIASVPAWAAPHRIDADALAFMIEAGNVVQVELPLGPGPRVVAELRRVDVLTDDATVVVAGPGGVETPLATSVSLWTGSVPGIEGSKVFLGISPMQAQGWITIGGTTHLIATRSLGGTPLALAYEQGMLEVAGALTPPTCAGEVVPEGDVTPATTTDEPTYSSRVACRAKNLDDLVKY